MQNLKLILPALLLLTGAPCSAHADEFVKIYQQKLDEKQRTLRALTNIPRELDPHRARDLHHAVEMAFESGSWAEAQSKAHELTQVRDYWLGGASNDSAESACDEAVALLHLKKPNEAVSLLQQRIDAMSKETDYKVAPGMVLVLNQQIQNYRALGDDAKAVTTSAQAARWQKLLPPHLAREYTAHGHLYHQQPQQNPQR